jgi:hypothetical protein
MATMMGKQLSLLCQGERPDLTVDSAERIPLHRFYPAGIACRIIAGHLMDTFTRRV